MLGRRAARGPACCLSVAQLCGQADLVASIAKPSRGLIAFLQFVANGLDARSAISLMCSKPSVPEKISTKAQLRDANDVQ